MLRNPEAETFFAARSAHSDVGAEWLRSLTRLGEFEVRGDLERYAAPYGVTAETVFCGAAGLRDTFWRLRPADYEIAIRSGAGPAPIGPQWVQITLFRPDWPQPDLAHWALRAYDYARTGE